MLPWAREGGTTAGEHGATAEGTVPDGVATPTTTASGHRHAPSVLPWLRQSGAMPPEDASALEEQLSLPSRPPPRHGSHDPSSERRKRFASGDFRKPQLSKNVGDPLTNSARRRSRGIATPATRPSAIQADVASTVVGGSEAAEAARDAARASLVAEAKDRATRIGLDGRVVGAVGGVMAVLSLLLPAAPDAPPLWRALIDGGFAAWPLGATLAAAATVLSAGLLLVALAGGSLRASNDADAAPEGGGVFAAVVALVALLLREASIPGSLAAATAPMRGDLLGLPSALWAGAAAAALLTLGRNASERPARVVGALAGLALTIAYWQPIVWLGKTWLPIVAALAGSAAVEPNTPMIEGPMMASPLGVVLLACVGPATLALLALPRSPARGAADGTAAILLLTPALAAALGAGTGGMAAIGAGAATLSAACLAAAAALSLLIRLQERFDGDTSTMLEGVAIVLIFGLYILLKVNGGRYSATDEGIYYYAAWAWSEGIWPYHDFFFSHPPLHIMPLTLVFGATGFSFFVAKAMSALATGLTGLLVWRIGRRHIGPVGGVLAICFFLFGAEVLKASTNLTGVNLTTMWLALALWGAMGRRYFLAGVAAGLATGTGIYAAGGAATLAVLLAFAPGEGDARGRGLLARMLSQPAVIFGIGVALIFGSIHIIGTLVGGEDFTRGVYEYHMQKRAKTPGYVELSEGPMALFANLLAMLQGRDFQVSFYYHGAHWWLAALSPLAVVVQIALRRFGGDAEARARVRGPASLADPDRWALLWNPRRWWLHLGEGGATLILFLFTFAMVGELAQFRERYDFYFVLVMPGLALLSAATLAGLLAMAKASAGAGCQPIERTAARDLQGAVLPAPNWVRPALVAGMVVAAAWVPLDGHANRAAFPSEITARAGSKGAGELLRFEWLDAPGPKLLSDFTRFALWKPWRIRGNLESGVHHFLWSKKRWFSTAEEIALAIRERGEPRDTVTGASTFAPLVALLAERRMAGDHVDTNSKTFKTGVVSVEDFWERVCADRLRFIVAAPHSYFTPASIQRMPTVQRYFKLAREFRDPTLKHWRDEVIQLWERKGEEPCAYVDANGNRHAPKAPPVAAPAPAAAAPAKVPEKPAPKRRKGRDRNKR